MYNHQDHTAIISRFSALNILVMGDFMVDVFLRGSSTRLCPEAPVPVVDISERLMFVGGAANTACNLKMLGSKVTFCTVVGEDAAGDEGVKLTQHILHQDYIFRQANRETIVKTRVVAGSQVITRFDNGTTTPLDEEVSMKIVAFLESTYASFDAIVISDYDKGILTPSIRDCIGKLQKKFQKFLAVDSKRLPFFKSLSPSLVKPNYEEATKLLNLQGKPNERKTQMLQGGAALSQLSGAQLVALTLDAEGSVIFEQGRPVYHAKADNVASPQVAGAGDAYLSAFLLSYVSSGNVPSSAEIASAAATLAIKKTSTATCTASELKCYFNMKAKRVANKGDLRDLCDTYRDAGRRIVFTNGCFDILHSGHVTYLESAKELGDVLIVGMNTDESISRLKGKSRPVNPLSDRLHVLAGLSSVNHIITFGSADDDTPINLISIVRPHVFVKGGDYTKESLPELDILESIGAEVVIIPQVPDRSTTRIIQRIHPETELIANE